MNSKGNIHDDNIIKHNKRMKEDPVYRKEHLEKYNKTYWENRSIEAAMNEELKKILLSEDPNKSMWFQNFLEKQFQEAMKHPDGKSAMKVFDMLAKENAIQMLDQQHEKQMNKDIDFQEYRILKNFFSQQREVIMDINHYKKIIVCCSRRAGKTDLAAGALCKAALIPNTTSIYMNLTLSNAITQMWDHLNTTIEKAGLVITNSSKNGATGTFIEFSNGSVIKFIGNSNNAEVDKLRGYSRVSLVVIDEFFHQRNMDYALNEVIMPFLSDLGDSATILCMGTPPRLPNTYGEKVWTEEKRWKHFHWTMIDNPYIPDPDKFIKEICESKGVDVDSPFIQREYFGRIGVYDTEALVFKDRQTYNKYDRNTAITDIAIGVDYGSRDYNSIITIAYNKQTKKAWVIKEDKFNRAGVSEFIEVIKQHYQTSLEILKDNRISKEHITIWCDTNDQPLTKDLMTIHNLPAFNAYKYDKAMAISMMSDEMRKGNILIPHNGILDKEMERILYKRDEETDAILKELDEEVGIHADAMMALLYATRKIFFDWNFSIGFKAKQPERKSNFITNDAGDIIAPLIEVEDGDGVIWDN